MSLLQVGTQANKDKYFFLLANVSTLNVDNVIAKNISTLSLNSGNIKATDISAVNVQTLNLSSFYIDTQVLSSFDIETDYAYISSLDCLTGNISSIVTNNITLDGNTIDTGGAGFGAVLLLNGLPIATGSSSLSSIADWSYFPALSTLQMGANNITNAGNITCQNIFNALNVQTDTLAALTSYTAPAGIVTNLRTTNLSSVNFVTSNINTGSLVGSLVSTVQTVGQTGVFRGVSSLAVSTGTINGVPFISGSNWSQYPATTTVQMNQNTLSGGSNFAVTASNLTITASNAFSNSCRDFTVVADEGINIASVANINLTAQNGTYGSVAITANGGFNNGINGVVNITANGSQVLGVGQGGSINLTANTPLGFSNLTSKISLSASGINSYAGVVPPLASAFGYNFVYGTNGVYLAAGLPPGLPNVPGTCYIYGTLGVEMPSDLYLKNIYPYWDGITTPPDISIEGRYIVPNLAQVCVRMSNVRYINFQSNFATYMSNLDVLAMSSNGSITTSNLGATVGTIGTLSNTSIVGAGSGNISGYNTISGSNINGFNILGSNSVSTVQTNLSSINGFAGFGQKSIRVNGDVAQIQLYNDNPGGIGTNLNLLSRVAFTEIQSFNSNFTSPRNLIFRGGSYGFNTSTISGGIAVDISGNTQVRGDLTVTDLTNSSVLTPYNLSVSSITGLQTINSKDIYTYGEFLTTSNVTVTNSNTPTVIPYDTNTVGNQVALTAGAIEVFQAGLYKYSVSIQLDKTGGGTDPCDFWVRVNGNDVANTGSQITVQGTNGEVLANCTYYLSLNANDKVESVFASPDNSMTAAYFPAWVTPGDPYDRPAIPAMIGCIELLR